jgi:glutaredoxin 3
MVQADRIIVYKSEPCPFCTAAIRFLREMKGQTVDIVDITGDWDARIALREQTGMRTVPQIYVGETHVGGFDDLRALDASGGLDPLLASVRSARG